MKRYLSLTIETGGQPEHPTVLPLSRIKLDLKGLLREIQEEGDYFELGSDTTITAALIRLIKADKKIALELESYFEIRTQDVKIVNIYFTLLGHLDSLEELVKKIHRSRYGTRKNTQDTLEKIQNCVNVIEKLLQCF
ncbi:MAG: hypothetical protein BroJett025_01290 [Patescibacteria group bacterium]|nr:MAG: hypothetical protein BroJett025_01290 [Patescibacteria group bacterium]